MTDLAVKSFPKNLAYSIKNLNGFSKQTIRILSDRLSGTAGPNDIIRFRLPPNSLIDLRTFSLYFDFSATIAGGGTGIEAHCPRYTSSLIQQLNVYINNTQVSTINDYNLYYNAIADMSFGGENHSKRAVLENFDPSVRYAAPNGANYFSRLFRATASGAGNDTNLSLSINNFLGFFNSSTNVIDTNDTGDIIIELRMAPGTVIWGSAPSGASAAFTGTCNYTLANIRASVSRISFNSSEYYELKASDLLQNGLMIGFQDVYSVRGNATQKSANVSWSYNVNANSLDYILATFQRSDFNASDYLQLLGASTGGSATNYDETGAAINATYRNYTFNEAIGNSGITPNTARADGDFFNQCRYFQRRATWFEGGQFSINSVMIDSYIKPASEVYNEALINLGMKNLDTSSSIHPGCISLFYFLKYYFVHICSLQNIAGDGQFWRSGLNGNSASLNIQYNATFNATATDSVFPLFFNVITKLLQISAGRIINVL